jgi:tRNA1Val (adenine37-N6)-methyltransferase
MANTYFKFKQFTIEQKACANKVSTDACVFGAWMARIIADGKVLDVGTGSALISLMLGQVYKEPIIGLELDETCTRQAIENVENSSFRNIQIEQGDIRTWRSETSFNWIISNPPFFNNTSKNEDAKKNLARQTETLGPGDWSPILNQLGQTSTTLALLLSNNDVLQAYEKSLSNAGYAFQQKMRLLDTKSADCKRIILFAKQEYFQIEAPATFFYKNDDGSYSFEFIDLLKAYYLYL